MKNIIIALLFSASSVFAQDQNEITKEIKGVIESDGHLMNDSVKFFIKVDLDGFRIEGTNGKKYQKRKCGNEKCKMIHLEVEQKYFTYKGSLSLPMGFSN